MSPDAKVMVGILLASAAVVGFIALRSSSSSSGSKTVKTAGGASAGVTVTPTGNVTWQPDAGDTGASLVEDSIYGGDEPDNLVSSGNAGAITSDGGSGSY